ncbi:bifunctional DNA-binding transcriptional regulator/O6-methylguanine-DNA methyltransferase Ada [Hyphomicrobium sp. CS1GBMeth3]|uniref:bifunctional DNA-binding transcriptional regulator/O6-methylguanine-DNA methyltransferase Ada n=1 Tax=Hyphomicrobium sp. CS1GBMeth3 TaxID=1892845 RepID=UPI000931C674|nr:bifunctional DNA-binding transcriptional regulator/O6-methylguanine-DNA methyltransferase Ada [Hyphomicrobium sp. CS1GBMeth3]
MRRRFSGDGEVAPSSGAADTRYWKAVQARDRRSDGTFVYAVATTGVYCRPSCAARRAKRENVSFCASWREAEAAGFRACKRCRPNERQDGSSLDMVREACRFIETAEHAPSLSELAARSGLSPSHFHRVFLAATGVTPKAYASAHRHGRLREALKTGATVTEAMHDAGFGSSSRLHAASRAALGMTPSEFKSGGANTAIRFAVGHCDLGAILVAASDKGITAILLGDDAEALVHELEDCFPRATLVGGDAAFEAVVSQVVGLVEAPEAGLGLPLDVRGTAFQYRVWEALSQIPVGATATYSEIAARIGMPKAVRAVASACASNKIAVAIPCHRVVRTDGSLSGYRWGVARKRALLKREAR